MITTEQIEMIQDLLREGKLKHKGIARHARVHRNTVAAVARGELPSGRPPDEETDQTHAAPPVARDDCEFSEDWLVPLEPPERCPGCGRKVYMPCQACVAERAAASTPRPFATAEDEGDAPAKLELRKSHRKRHEEVLRRRLVLAFQSARPVPNPQSLTSNP